MSKKEVENRKFKKMNQNKTIVIAEDSATQAANLQYILEDNGYTVFHGKNGREAFQIIQKKMPDLVISDILMPVMDGFDLTKQIKGSSKLKQIPIILVTALSGLNDILKGLELGAENYIIKPYEEKELISKVETVLKNSSTGIVKLREDKLIVTHKNNSYTIDSKSTKVIDFLITTYENVLNRNKIIEKTQNELRILNESLEEKVLERTAELRKEVKERKQFQIALEESEERFRILYNSSPDMYVSVSPKDATIQFCNDTLLKLTGYTREDIIGKPVFIMYHKDSLDKAKVAFQEFTEGRKVLDKELVLRRKDGSKIEVSLNVDAVRNEAGEILYSISSWRDITERKLTEKTLQESENHLRQLSFELQERNC